MVHVLYRMRPENPWSLCIQVVSHITDAIKDWIEGVVIPVDRKKGPADAKAFKHVKALSQIPSHPLSFDESPLLQGDRVTGTSGHSEKMLSSAAPDKHTCTPGSSRNWMVLSISGDKPAPRSYHATVVIQNKMIVVGGGSGSGLLDDVQVPLEGFSALQGILGAQRFQIHKAYETSDHLPFAHTWFHHLMDHHYRVSSIWSFDTYTECWSPMEAKACFSGGSRCDYEYLEGGSGSSGRRMFASDEDRKHWVAEPGIDRKASDFITKYYAKRVTDSQHQFAS
ncbi:hypothetical protein D0Y65_041317 [Glycine soja]|uniref:HECT domain-containing protein n=1 Tax=Glycine soja TaxID=3848 RepID=A0A445GV90_GLYSO|nr:hypothetical protein D0Y65_041317 [Glycine soja]